MLRLISRSALGRRSAWRGPSRATAGASSISANRTGNRRRSIILAIMDIHSTQGCAGSSKRPLDDDLLHVRCAFVDLADAHVAVDALHRKIVDVAVAAQGLDGGAADGLGGFA